LGVRANEGTSEAILDWSVEFSSYSTAPGFPFLQQATSIVEK